MSDNFWAELLATVAAVIGIIAGIWKLKLAAKEKKDDEHK